MSLLAAIPNSSLFPLPHQLPNPIFPVQLRDEEDAEGDGEGDFQGGDAGVEGGGELLGHEVVGGPEDAGAGH